MTKRIPRKYVDFDGTERWFLKEDFYHREDGPAIITPIGSEFWFYLNKKHRIDGPAIIECAAAMRKEWWRHGVRHRSDGPAYESIEGKFFFYNGEQVTDHDAIKLFTGKPEDEIILRLKYGV